jgi:hypothetical protein
MLVNLSGNKKGCAVGTSLLFHRYSNAKAGYFPSTHLQKKCRQQCHPHQADRKNKQLAYAVAFASKNGVMMMVIFAAF